MIKFFYLVLKTYTYFKYFLISEINESENDIFADSFANVCDELDKMENEQSINNRSCPKVTS